MTELTNAVVISKKYGEGTVISVYEDTEPRTGEAVKKVKVQFDPKYGTKDFLFWSSFPKKFLVCKDPALQKEVEQLILQHQTELESAQAEQVKKDEEKKMKQEEKKLKQEEAERKEKEKTAERMLLFTPNLEMKYSLEKLRKAIKEGQSFTYLPFSGHRVTKAPSKYCLSNWYPCEFVVDGVTYHTTEQFMMAQKALLFQDQAVYEMIMASDRPQEYKALGRKVKNYNEKTWGDYKYSIVLEGCKAKFSQNVGFKQFLLSTGNDVIIEAAKWDNIWGIKLPQEDPRVNDPFQWQGTNLLGFILMEVRDYLKEN